ncbi:purine and uridine phosphorylase [Ophiobolus disseminans]|uniref:Purine and uridine phosphorylase n=1 Tax=Ophiobolus disseminans TaxID=1469910 RepID=A0A6A6ZB59_9PLEO|nr:purine and uridine phosphorylase [Ophiobolus disseminans]
MSKPEDYTIGWICALHEELVAAQAFLDEEHDPPAQVSRHDANDYTLGRIGQHNVVIAVLPSSELGTASAASVARDMVHSFPNVRLGLIVGIGGGAPSRKHDIRLGDVVVSNPEHGNGSVFQYDFGKTIQGQGFKTTGVLDQPPRALRTAVNGLRARYARTGHEYATAIHNVFEKFPKLRKKYKQPDIRTDRLYQPHIVHPQDNDTSCTDICGDSLDVLISRSERTEDDDNPAIHYGIIASANQVMKDALVRDKIAAANDVLCFEMEAAGLMNNFPCLVICGICDYADSHKKKEWQGYAAMTAAAYAKDILQRIAPDRVEAEQRLAEALHNDVVSMRKAAEENRDISRKGLEIQQETIKQNLSDKEKKCLQSFRRARSEKDATYEWFKDRIEERVPGTCNWLTDHENFKQWLKQDSGLLLVSADPGCGKSVLAKYLIDHFLPGQVLPGSLTICYFFFKDQDQNTVCKALCALLHQLFSQKSNAIHHAMQEYETNGEKLIDAPQSLWTILGRVMQDPETGPVITILDALDECAELDDLMRNLEAHFRSNQSSCSHWKCLITSRPYEQIVSKFRGLLADFPRIHIPGEESSETISHEINRVIEYKVDRLTRVKELSEQVRNHIANQFLKIPHRTYLWVYLVFDNLESEDFKQTLKGKALSIILAAERPLTLSEMNVAMNIESTSRSINDLDLEEEPRFRSRLRSLVYFLHQTAREFLLADLLSSPTIPTKLKWHQCVTIQNAHRVLAEVCVRFLSFFSFNTASRIDASLEVGFHFRKAHISIDEAATVSLALGISKPNSKGYSVWYEVFRKSDRRLKDIFFSTSLTVASYFGHSAIVQSLLERNVNVNERGGFYGNALQAASVGGHEQVVKLLLKKNADVNAQGGGSGNALYAASERGYEQVVKLLLEKNADVNAKGGHYGNAIQAASVGGHEQVREATSRW